MIDEILWTVFGGSVALTGIYVVFLAGGEVLRALFHLLIAAAIWGSLILMGEHFVASGTLTEYKFPLLIGVIIAIIAGAKARDKIKNTSVTTSLPAVTQDHAVMGGASILVIGALGYMWYTGVSQETMLFAIIAAAIAVGTLHKMNQKKS